MEQESSDERGDGTLGISSDRLPRRPRRKNRCKPGTQRDKSKRNRARIENRHDRARLWADLSNTFDSMRPSSGLDSAIHALLPSLNVLPSDLTFPVFGKLNEPNGPLNTYDSPADIVADLEAGYQLRHTYSLSTQISADPMLVNEYDKIFAREQADENAQIWNLVLNHFRQYGAAAPPLPDNGNHHRDLRQALLPDVQRRINRIKQSM